MHASRIALLIIATLFASLTTALAEQTRYVIGSWETPGTFTYRYQEKILQETFKRMGYTLEIRPYVHKDILIEQVRKGKIDGDAARSKRLVERFPEYIIVDTPTYSLEVGVYATKDYPVSDWESLYALDRVTGYIIGTIVCEEKLKAGLSPRKIRGFAQRIEGFEALAAGEIDLLVMANQYTGQEFMRLERFKAADIHHLAVLQKGDVYTYLHKKHADLAQRLNKVLKEMQQCGFFDKCLRETMEF